MNAMSMVAPWPFWLNAALWCQVNTWTPGPGGSEGSMWKIRSDCHQLYHHRRLPHLQCIALDIVAPNVQGSSMKRRRSCPCFHAETPAEEEEHVKAQGWAERVDDRDAWPLADSIVNSPTMPYAGGGEPSNGGEADEQETESDDDDNGVNQPVRLAR
eukprot:3858814-Amphidinium_carterae.1